MLGPLDDGDHCNRWRRINRAVGILVIEADISACDWRVEGAAGFGHTANRFLELIKNFRIVRIAEIEVVGCTQRSRAGTSEVAGGFCYGDFSALIRIEVNVSGVAIDRERNEFFGDLLVTSW